MLTIIFLMYSNMNIFSLFIITSGLEHIKMNSAFLSFTMFLLKQNSSWVTNESWKCLNSVVDKYLTLNSLVVLSDSDTRKLHSDGKTLYTSSKEVPPKRENIEVVLIHQKLKDWHGSDVHGKIILLTESLDDILILWTKFKIVDLIVILQTIEKCEVYIWFPYTPETCGKVALILFDVWENGQFLNNSDLALDRIPKQFNGCTLNISFSECPPFIMIAPDQKRIGPEIKILNALVKQLGMDYGQLNFPFQTYYVYFDQNGSYSGSYKLLDDRTVDIAGSCLSMGTDKMDFDFLPSHFQDTVTWLLPGPEPKTIAFGFITALPLDLWIAISVLYFLVFSFTAIATPKTLGNNFLWTSARFLSLPNQPLGKTLVLRCFSFLLELTILVLSSIYRSLILLQLCKIPMLILSTASIGIDYGLHAQIRARDESFLNHTDHEFWNRLLVPGKFDFKSFDYDLLIRERSAMLLGRVILDQAMIRLRYPNVNYKTAVTVQKNYFMTIDMAFVLPAHYPLTELFSVKLLNVVQAGLPELYLDQTLKSLSKGGEMKIDEKHKPLKLIQVLTIFYLLLILLLFSLLVFIWEIIPCNCLNKKYFY